MRLVEAAFMHSNHSQRPGSSSQRCDFAVGLAEPGRRRGALGAAEDLPDFADATDHSGRISPMVSDHEVLAQAQRITGTRTASILDHRELGDLSPLVAFASQAQA